MMKTYLDSNEIKLLENATSNLRDKLLIRVLFHLGCRISEALAIKVDDIDFTQHTITIVHLKSRIALSCNQCGQRLGKSHTYCPRCGVEVKDAVERELEQRRQRILPLDQATLVMLKDFIDRGGPVVKDGKRFLFGINRHRAWQIVKECAERAGLPKLINPETGKMHNVSPHKLRDAFAVNAMKVDDSGNGQRLLQEQLGHQSFNTTAKYRKIAGEELRDWYDRLWKENTQ
jgi:integrase/recombinase XerD